MVTLGFCKEAPMLSSALLGKELWESLDTTLWLRLEEDLKLLAVERVICRGWGQVLFRLLGLFEKIFINLY